MTATMNVSDIVVPDVRLIKNYFNECGFRPSFLTSVPHQRSYLYSAANLSAVAGLINTTMGWSGTPQGSSYWSSVHRNLSKMASLLEHCHKMSVDPTRYTATRGLPE